MTKASRLDELSMEYGILGVPDDEDIENEEATEDSFDAAFEAEPEAERVGPLAVPLEEIEVITEDSFPTLDPVNEDATAVTDPAVEEIRVLPLASIKRDLQVRVETRSETVTEYAEKLRRGIKLSLPLVFDTGTEVVAADGNHTLAAFEMNEEAEVECRVRRGSRRDALLFAVGCNDEHGLPRSNADKRRAVQLLLEDSEWGLWSDRVIAKQCNVTPPLIGKVAKELALPRPGTKRTAGGRKMNTRAIGKGKSPEREPVPPDLPTVNSLQCGPQEASERPVPPITPTSGMEVIHEDAPPVVEALPADRSDERLSVKAGTLPPPAALSLAERKTKILSHLAARDQWFPELQGHVPNVPKGVIQVWLDEVDSYSWLPEDAADALVQVDGLYERLNRILAQCSVRRVDLKGRPAPKERELLSEIERRVKRVCTGLMPHPDLEKAQAEVADIEEQLSAHWRRLLGRS